MGFPFLILTVVGLCYLDETPAFLLYQKKYEECKKVLQTITRVNKRPDFKFKLLEEMHEVNQKYTTAMDLVGGKTMNIRPMRDSSYMSIISESPTYKDSSGNLIKVKRKSVFKLFSRHMRLFFLWAVHYFAYFGFPLLIQGGNTLVLNFTLLGCVELFGILLTTSLLRNHCRVSSMRICVFFCLLTCVLYYFLDKNYLYLLVSKFFLTIFFGALQVYTLEVFSTEIRSQGFSYCFTFGRLCAIFLPLALGRFSALKVDPVLLLTVLFSLSLLSMIGLKKVFKKKIKTCSDDPNEKLID
jgi:hypothetical protein